MSVVGHFATGLRPPPSLIDAHRQPRIGPVKVNLQAQPAAGAKFPDCVDGVPVRVEVVGTIRKH
jgi:hypothetical protein